MNTKDVVKSLGALPGVQGMMICDHSGRTVEGSMPDGFQDALAIQLGRECGLVCSTLTTSLKEVNEVVLKSSSGSLLLVLLENHLLVIFLSKYATVQLIQISLKAVYKKFDPLFNSGVSRRADRQVQERTAPVKILQKSKPKDTPPESDGIWG